LQDIIGRVINQTEFIFFTFGEDLEVLNLLELLLSFEGET